MYLNVCFFQINANFQRKSAALACRRFKGTHSYDRIAEMIHDIHCEFKLDAKNIVKVTTDNASNMMKAFSMFSQNNQTIDLDNDNDNSDNDFVIRGITELTEGIAGDSGSISEILLPIHQRCVSHTLNLLVTMDIKAALTGSVSGNSGGSYTRSYHSAFGKCSAIWNLTSRSPKAAETYVAITGKASSSPCVTRWNSIFDCLNDLITVKQFLGSVCDALELPKFKDTDLEFLAEYIECVKPIAEALNRLQGEKNCFYGELLSVLLQTQKKLQKLQHRHLKYCAKLVDVLLESLNKRFSDYFNFSHQVNDAILAAVNHPFFKLRWVPKERKK